MALRPLVAIFAAGMMVGSAALLVLPSHADRGWTLGTSVRVSDLPLVSCTSTAWPNAERVCPRGDPSRYQAADTTREPAPPVRRDAATTVAVAPAPLLANGVALAAVAPWEPELRLTAAVAAAPAKPDPRRVTVAAVVAADKPLPEAGKLSSDAETPRVAAKPKPARTRAPAAADPIRVTAVAADGARRHITIRPTSQQDIYYYGARGEYAAITPFGVRR